MTFLLTVNFDQKFWKRKQQQYLSPHMLTIMIVALEESLDIHRHASDIVRINFWNI